MVSFPPRNILCIFLLLVSVLLSACTVNNTQGPGPSTTVPQWKQHQQQVEKVTRYRTRGVFAYISNRKKIYARFNWQQSAPDLYSLLLTSPLGSTELQLNAQGKTVQLIDNKGKRYVSNDVEKLIAQLTGMNIPLTKLRQWIMGHPDNISQYQLNSNYQLKSLKYNRNGQHWQVNIQSYDNKVTPAMPMSIELREDDQCIIKLRMDSWSIP
ncbi:lipoprotein insertase outer membrane protein LolB [Pantoea sp. Nvir]|uniref:lipoprotein insertase outer membrane protein LolB n=1 Tax=Pantoea sp. Nvir TaxID=2576760 RepID=UPI0027FA6A00|nr:lipoprotein insertase outer membrane protein LolB [Pantoea sp. Nvir]CAJ0991646.1 Outer-membrane lipoprotein LolB [Pantoea sp. Nvir]